MSKMQHRVLTAVEQLINPNQQTQLEVFLLKKAAVYEQGGCFGERSLIKNQDRAATVICRDEGA